MCYKDMYHNTYNYVITITHTINWEHLYTSHLISYQMLINNQSNNLSQLCINCWYMNTLPETFCCISLVPLMTGIIG